MLKNNFSWWAEKNFSEEIFHIKNVRTKEYEGYEECMAPHFFDGFTFLLTTKTRFSLLFSIWSKYFKNVIIWKNWLSPLWDRWGHAIEIVSNQKNKGGFFQKISSNMTFSCMGQARLLCVLSADYQLKVVTVKLPDVMCYSWNILFWQFRKKKWLLLSTNCHNFKLQASEHIDLIHKVIMSGMDLEATQLSKIRNK